jgi:transcriptional regulator with XRE-family HTH domain
MDIGMDLIEASRKAGVRGVHIAGSLGVAHSTVNRWLHGETPVPLKHLRQFAELIGVPPSLVRPDVAEAIAPTEPEIPT